MKIDFRENQMHTTLWAGSRVPPYENMKNFYSYIFPQLFPLKKSGTSPAAHFIFPRSLAPHVPASSPPLFPFPAFFPSKPPPKSPQRPQTPATAGRRGSPATMGATQSSLDESDLDLDSTLDGMRISATARNPSPPRAFPCL